MCTVLSVLMFLTLGSLLSAGPYVEVSRDGSTITLTSYVDIARSRVEVWPYVWEYRFMHLFLQSYDRIDSLEGGIDWYNVRYVGDFPLFSSLAAYKKQIVEEGFFVTESLYESKIEGPIDIRVLSANSCWRLDSLTCSQTRVFYVNVVEISAAGFEGIYSGVIKGETRKALASLKKLIESS